MPANISAPAIASFTSAPVLWAGRWRLACHHHAVEARQQIGGRSAAGLSRRRPEPVNVPPSGLSPDVKLDAPLVGLGGLDAGQLFGNCSLAVGWRVVVVDAG